MALSTEARLLAKVPALPKPINKTILDSTMAGLKAYRAGGGFSRTGDPHQLTDMERRKHWFYGQQYVHVPDKDVDLFKKNTARRKLMAFTAGNAAFRKSLNKDLSGGEDYPLLTTMLGLTTGFISAGAGFLWTGFTTALALAKETQPVRARDGDEVHQLEVVGKFENQLTYVEWIILVDPFRVKANRDIRQWIISESRHRLHVA